MYNRKSQLIEVTPFVKKNGERINRKNKRIKKKPATTLNFQSLPVAQFPSRRVEIEKPKYRPQKYAVDLEYLNLTTVSYLLIRGAQEKMKIKEKKFEKKNTQNDIFILFN